MLAHYQKAIRELPQVTVERYGPHKLLWIKVIVRAAWDYALWKDDHDMRKRKMASDAARWLFEESHLVNGLENICHAIDVDVDMVRTYAQKVTRDQVKKMEFLERSGGRDPIAALLSGSPLEAGAEEEDWDDGDSQ